ncbi:MAG: EF-Tu/IF-2/RF-3 family GTPase [bacterium]|nr:EF-Tu/IF-2/RF-3 family GTPase [bacterium]
MDLNQFIVDDSFSILGKGTVFVGRVLRGTIKAGMKCTNFPDREVIIRKIEKPLGGDQESASAGQSVGLMLEGLDSAERETVLNFI